MKADERAVRLKRERIKRHIYATRDDARADVVDDIEMFSNRKRRHGFKDLLSPAEYENRFSERLVSVQRIGCDSVVRATQLQRKG